MTRTERIALWGILAALAGVTLGAQQTVVTCPAGQTPTPTVSGQSATVVCVAGPVTPPPTPVACVGTWGAWAAVPPGTWGACVNGTQSRQERRTFTVTTPPANGGTACPASPENRTASQACTVQGPNTAVLTNAAAHPSSGIANGVTVNMDWTSTGGNPLAIAIERPDGSTVTPGPAVTARTFPVPAVNGLWRVVYNRGLTWSTGASLETWRHVTITTTGGAPPPVEPPPVVPPPNPGTGQIWTTVTAAELGECSAAAHDVHTVDGGDGWRYRVWHDQRDPSGCIYGHEHGDDPGMQTNAWVRQNWDGRMGYGARRDSTMPGEPNGHMEPHNGYKVHVANIGEMNDEGRVNRNATTSMPHMGTGGPARFSVNRHSVSIADWHENGTHHTAVHTMFDTGTRGNSVCEPRVNAPTKDGLVVNSASGCKMDSSYEIWGMAALIRYADGRDLLHKFVTPAVFDPITVHNRSNPSELVYAWDPRVAQYKNHPNDWSGYRGCAREGYSQVGYHFTGGEGTGTGEYLLDVRTNRVVATSNAFTTRLVVGRSNSAGSPPFSSNILQYKKRRDHCDQRSKLSLTN